MSNNKVYIAGPLFSPGDRHYLEQVDSICKELKLETYLPHRDAGLAPSDGSETRLFFARDLAELESCALVVAVLNGADVDSGTAWELGYAFAKGIPCFAIYEDTRIDEPLRDVNLMLTSSIKSIARSQLELRSAVGKYASSTCKVGTRAPSSPDVDKVLQRAKTDKLDFSLTTPETFGHSSSALCCIDAVLSINRNYRQFVQPRLRMFQAEHPEVASLLSLQELIDNMKPASFALDVLHYDHADRVRILSQVVKRLLQVSGVKSDTTSDEREALRRWARSANAGYHNSWAIHGFGIATSQYLRMLLGASTVKPDVHLIRFLQSALGRRVQSLEAINLIEQSAISLKIEPIALDHAIWRRSSEVSLSERGRGKKAHR